MPFFGSSSPFDGDVEKATSEMNTTEDWALIMDICDKVQRTTNGPKDCLKSIVKRLNHRVPHVAMQAVTMLDAGVNNCGQAFLLEIASRDFESECRVLIGGKAHQKVAQKLKLLIKKWAEGEFKSEPALNLIPTLYQSLKADGHDFSSTDTVRQTTPKSTPAYSDNPDVANTAQEEEDLAKAIALSLQENEKKDKAKTQSLYPTFSSVMPSSSSPTPQQRKESRKVRALYDFEAAEDNELTFEAGEFISILDDSDPNWWKGYTGRGDGLFPANFVTADLTVEPEDTKESKSVSFSEEVEVKTLEDMPEVVEIEEDKIDKALDMIQNADPTGESHPDSPDMLMLEEQSKAMGPLIDQELEKIDRKHNALMELNQKLVDSLGLYHSLMKEMPSYSYPSMPPSMPKAPAPQYGMAPQPQMYNGGSGPYLPQGQAPPMTQPHGHMSHPSGPPTQPPTAYTAESSLPGAAPQMTSMTYGHGVPGTYNHPPLSQEAMQSVQNGYVNQPMPNQPPLQYHSQGQQPLL